MLEKMLQEIEKGKVNEILVSDYSRISRDILQLDNFVSRNLTPKNIKLISIQDNSNYYDTQKIIRGNIEKEIKTLKKKSRERQ